MVLAGTPGMNRAFSAKPTKQLNTWGVAPGYNEATPSVRRRGRYPGCVFNVKSARDAHAPRCCPTIF